MKTRLAMALSVAGVLSAGSAAALVNTQILDGGPVESSASAAILPATPTVDVAIPELAAATIALPTTTTTEAMTDLSPVTEQAAALSTTQAAPLAAPSMLTAFNVGDAGVVTVDVIGGHVVLVDAQPKSGWNLSEAVEKTAENQLYVVFSSSTVRVDFEATLVDGQIVPSVSSNSIGGTTSPAPADQTATPAVQSHDDDEYESEDDDEYESEDDDEYESHDDDEYESEGDDEHEGERDDD